MAVDLNDQFLAKIAGWDVIKQARSALAGGRVLSSNWTPPVLKGVVQEGQTSFRCGLVIKDAIDIENLCTCRAARTWGTMCVHSIAVGLHEIQKRNPSAPPPSKTADPKPLIPSGVAKPERACRRIKTSPNGLSLEISVIFPPNFQAALARGKVMLYFEGVTARGRSPLNTLAGGETYAIDAADAKLLEALHAIAGDTPGMFIAGVDELTTILNALKDHPRVSLGKKEDLDVASEPADLSLRATLEPSGEITLQIDRGQELGTLIGPAWVLQGNSLHPIQLPAAGHAILREPVTIPRPQIPTFLNQDFPSLQKSGRIAANFDLDQFEVVTASPGIILELSGGIADLRAILSFDYGPIRIPAGNRAAGAGSSGMWMPDPTSPTRYGTRDLAAEQAALARLLRAGFTGPHDGGHLQLAGQNAVLAFFARDYYKLEREWTVTLEERLQRSTDKNLERIEPSFEVASSGEQWFDLDVAYQSGSGERFSPAEIQRLIRSGQSHTRLKNGKFAIIDTGAVEELQEVLLDCAPRQHEKGYRIQNTQAGFLASALGENRSWKVSAPASWRERASTHADVTRMDPPPLGDLESVLRPYQKHGVGWLEFLRRSRFGGILADEMGLGKTLQTLAHLWSTVDRTPPSERLPSLIVCPTSLVFNWAAEAAKFTPRLRVLALHGPRRQELFAKIPDSDLVITSYALVRRDAENYAGLEFDTVVLDEAQHIKNRQTQNAQAVKTIRARNRFVLTGTPIENSVLDLWSIFDFLMPGYLGSAADFKERYEGPITRDRDEGAQKRLTRRIRPFLLRRLKKDVVADLPARIEQVSFCELTAEQQQVYQQLLEASRQEITDAVDQQGLQKSRMIILTALLRLRQICCDLRLLKLREASENNSGKLDLFQELLQEVLDGGHRVLVFSQFVEMLALLKESLAREEIPFSYLDGSTVDRAKAVEIFQSNPSIPVFLISLKAGGVGLNLTGADTVIHFDPWWNPAVEAQATDRAHRIGQARIVTSYKLITRGTVEEKMLNLQNRKRELIHATLSGEEQLAGNLSLEELQDLFS